MSVLLSYLGRPARTLARRVNSSWLRSGLKVQCNDSVVQGSSKSSSWTCTQGNDGKREEEDWSEWQSRRARRGALKVSSTASTYFHEHYCCLPAGTETRYDGKPVPEREILGESRQHSSPHRASEMNLP